MAHINANDIADKLKNFSNFLIVCGGSPSIDSLASALALSLALNATGKATQMLTKNPIRAEHSRLVGCDKVTSQISGQKSFVISLPNAVDAIEKVSCYAEGTKLNIVLQPYADIKDFNLSDMQYAKIDANFDAIVLIDVMNMQEIASLLGQQANLLQQIPVFAIGREGDNRLQNKLVDPTTPATSEIIFHLLQAMNIRLNADASGNLLQGIYAATNDFHTPTITPSIFEDAAKLLQFIHTDTGRPQSPVAPPPPASPRPPMQPVPPRPNQFGQPPRSDAVNQPDLRSPMPSRPMTQPASPTPPIPRQPMPQPPRPPVQPREVAGEFEMEENFELEQFSDGNFVSEAMPEASLMQVQTAVAQGSQHEAVSMRTTPPQQTSQKDTEGQSNQVPRDVSQGQQRGSQNRSQGNRQGGQNQNRNQKQSQGQQQSNDTQDQPDDWLAPKIYKTEDLL